MEENTSVFSSATFCVITGASRGFGRAVARGFARRFPAGSTLLLISRSQTGLEETKNLIKKEQSTLNIIVRAVDLGEQDEKSFEDILNGAFLELDQRPDCYKQAMVFHNAANMGDISKNLTEFSDVSILNKFWNENLTSCIVLNSVFFKIFNSDVTAKRVAITITSLASLQPFKSWSLYCACKSKYQ